MRSKIISSCIALLIVLLSFGGIYYLQNQDLSADQMQKRGTPLFPDFSIGKIDCIVIKDGEQSTTLIKDKQENWVVLERYRYAANTVLINQLFTNLRDAIIMDVINVSSEKYSQLGLNPNKNKKISAPYSETKKIEIFINSDQNPNPFYSLTLGKSFNIGEKKQRYALINNAPPYLLQDHFSFLSANPATWLDPSFIGLKNIVSISYFPPPGIKMSGWTISRESVLYPFSMQDEQTSDLFDFENAESAAFALQGLKFSDILPASERKDGESSILSVKTDDDLIYTFDSQDAGNGQLWVSISIGPQSFLKKSEFHEKTKFCREHWIFKIPAIYFNPLFKSKMQWFKSNLPTNADSSLFTEPQEDSPDLSESEPESDSDSDSEKVQNETVE